MTVEGLLSNFSKSEALAIGAVASATLTTILFVSLIIYVLYIIINWRIFKKMGEPGWKSIIPILNDITLWNRVWSIKAYLIYLLEIILVYASTSYYNSIYKKANGKADTMVIVVGIIALILIIVLLIRTVRFEIHLSRSFGKGMLFVLGLIFLPFIFDMILAFGSAKYIGNNGINIANENKLQ